MGIRDRLGIERRYSSCSMTISFSTSCGVAPGQRVNTVIVRTSRSGIICTGMRKAATMPSTHIVCVLGIVAAFRIPVQMIPDLEVRTITVFTRWPGATPQDVEKEIVIEQEEYLRSIPSLERIISRASSGEARIELELSLIHI